MTNTNQQRNDAAESNGVEVLDTHCYLIRKALDIEEQITLFEDIRSRDNRYSIPPKTKPLYPSPRTVQLDENIRKIKFSKDDPATFYSELVDKANAGILQTTTSSHLSNYQSITLSAIEYEASKHSLAKHVDHDDSFVYLLSIGCTTNFVVKGPNMRDEKCILLQSGDLIVFNASTTGGVLHGITSIDSDTCPAELANRCPVLCTHRYGIQLRVRF